MKRFLRELPGVLGALLGWLALCAASLLFVLAVVALAKVLWMVVAI
jgi:hypothetical protein|nr:MAG TPA_asm: hypothetical protein [Caudoviricetes sp.]